MLLQTFRLLADASASGGMSTSDIGPAISMIGSLGISIWYVYYTTTVAIPRMHRSHRIERFQLIAAHRAERGEMQDRFDKALVEMRSEFDTDVQALLTELKESRLQFTQWMTERRAGQPS